MSDPVKNISYNLTEAHQKAVAPLLEGTDSGGYSLELAREYFRLALEELEAAGKYEPGTPENPRVIEIQIAWQYAQHEDSQHKYIKQYWEDAFNHESVHGGCYKLEVSFWVGEDWADVYYKKMMMGQFDIGFGSISGNPLDPLAFMNVCSSDKSISSDFTLNWGADTNDPDSDIIVYNGMRWSYDALWSATQAPTVVKNGRLVPVASLGESSFTRNENGVAAELTVNVLDGYNYSKDALMIFGYVDVEGEAAYYEVAIDEYLVDTVVGEGTVTYKLQIPASVYASFIAGKSQGVDIYWSYDIDGAEVSEAFGGTFAFDFVPAE